MESSADFSEECGSSTERRTTQYCIFLLEELSYSIFRNIHFVLCAAIHNAV